MGRQKQHKPRRPRGGNDQPTTEWFGTAFHSTEGVHHLDVRQSGNGILITCSPAEVDGVPAAWTLRLRNDDDGQGLNDLSVALAAGQPHIFGVEEVPGRKTVHAFPGHRRTSNSPHNPSNTEPPQTRQGCLDERHRGTPRQPSSEVVDRLDTSRARDVFSPRARGVSGPGQGTLVARPRASSGSVRLSTCVWWTVSRAPGERAGTSS